MVESKLLLTVEEAAERLSIGRSLMYEHVLRGEIRSVRIGRCRRIAERDLESFVERLQDHGAESLEPLDRSAALKFREI